MKRILLFLISITNAQAATPLRLTYEQLQKTPGYKGMSKLEIAIDRDDFEAMRHFSYTASQENLIQAQALLNNKLDIQAINIAQIESDLQTAVNRVLTQQQLDKERKLQRLLTNELNNIKRRIKKEPT